AEEVAELVGGVRLRLREVVEVESELLRELLHLRVVVVDQLAAVLVQLAVGKVAATAPAPSADPPRGLVHLGGVPGLLEPVRARQAGEPGSDDDDARPGRQAPTCPRRRSEPAEERRAGQRRAHALQETAPVDAAVLACERGRRLLDCLGERSPCQVVSPFCRWLTDSRGSGATLQ